MAGDWAPEGDPGDPSASMGAVAAPPAPPAPPSAPPMTVAPSLLQQLFPGGIPQAAVATAGAPSPVSPADLSSLILAAYGRLPKVGTSDVTAGSTLGALGGSVPGASAERVQAPSVLGAVGDKIGPNALVDQVLASLQPTFQNQQRGLTESLANAGIVGGSTAGAQGDLSRAQTQTALGAIAPYEQTAQQMLLSGATTDAGNALSARVANQNAGLGASEFNIGNELGVTQADLERALRAQITNQQAGLQTSSANVGNALGTGTTFAQQILDALKGNQAVANQNAEFNAGTLNAGTQYNVGNELNAAQYDTGATNTLLSQILGYQNQDWLSQLGINAQMAAGAAGGQTNAYQPVFQQPSPVNFSGLAGAFSGSGYRGGAPSPAPTPGFGTSGKVGP